MLHPLIATLSTETATLFLFGFFVTSVFISGCIQTFTSSSHRYRFHSRQHLRHSLSSVAAFYSLTSVSPAVALPFSRLLRLPVAVVGFLVILLFHCRPLIRSLQLVITIIGLSLVYFGFSYPMLTRCRPNSRAGELYKWLQASEVTNKLLAAVH